MKLITRIKNLFVKEGNVSDGCHTFDVLYDYRMAYNAAFFNELYKKGKYHIHKSHRHYNGKECFGGGWFVVVAELPTGQVTNHYENKYWDLFKCEEREHADAWDGHSPEEALFRIKEYVKNF